MRKLLIVATSLLLLAACGRGPTPSENILAMPSLTGWGDVATEDINVPQGITANSIEVEGTRVMEIAGIPEGATATQKTGGVSVRMSDDFENRVSGNQVLVTVRAYAQQPGARLGVAYSTNDVGNSGWREFELTTAPADYQFVYNVPEKQAGMGDYLGFRSYGNQSVLVVGFQTSALPRAQGAVETPLRATTQGE